MQVHGSCHCGEIKFEAELDPAKVVICNCTDCQSLSGSAFRTVAMVSEETYKRLGGTPKVYVKVAESGNEREQTFCGTCGSPIYATSVGNEGSRVLGLRVGVLEERDQLVPQKKVWGRSALHWLEDMPAMPMVEKV